MKIAIALYFIIMGLFNFVLFRWDKQKAKANAYRISEKTLILISVLGGAWGAILGMFIGKNHKTRKWKFILIIPFALLIHLYIIYKLKLFLF